MSTKPLSRPGFRHSNAGMSDSKFFAHIDETGGWPVGYSFVGFEHSTSRDAGFTNENINTGWWTTIASADDYYLWKLSPDALRRIAEAVRDTLTISQPNLAKLAVRGGITRLAATSIKDWGER